MRRILVQNGVAEEDIVVGDNTSTVASDIVNNIRSLVEEFSSVTVMAYAPYLRRTVGTMRFQGIDTVIAPQPVNVFGLTLETWHEVAGLDKMVLKESDNMNPDNSNGYVGQYCTAVDVVSEQRRASDLPIIPPRGVYI